jgi:hypothetical protein
MATISIPTLKAEGWAVYGGPGLRTRVRQAGPLSGPPSSALFAQELGVKPAGRAMDFISKKLSSPSGPNSRPTPDSL